jgi:hypothetical protein
MNPNMDNSKLRAWWWHKQGLDGSLAGKTAAEVLAAAGWARSVAGIGPYLTLFCRAGLRRPEIDATLAAIEIQEIPSARGCTYVLPASEYALGLKVGQSFGENEMKVARKLGVTDAEIANLRQAIARALSEGPLDPEGLRAMVGTAARSLGPEGVKKGLASTLPLALGAMQSAGDIRRIPIDGRLDRQRYKYALWKPNPLTSCKRSADDCFIELASRFFRWTGGATQGEFQWFSGLGVKSAKAALEPLKLEPVGDYFMLPEDRVAFETFKPSKAPQYALVGSLDSIGQLRRDLKSLLAGEDLDRDFMRSGAGSFISDMPSHAIMDRGRVIGWWEYDTGTASIAWMCFTKPDAAIQSAIDRTEVFIREDLGDARSFSLDSPKSRAPKIAAIRKGKLVSAKGN